MEAVKQLTPTEKLKLNEALWSDDFSVPIEHQNIVRRRIKDAKLHPETMIDWEEASKLR